MKLLTDTMECHALIDKYIPTMEGWSTPRKCKALANAIKDSNASLSYEIGIFAGRGLVAMAMAHREIKKGHAFGIDTWSPVASLEGSNSPVNDEWWSKLDYAYIFRCFKNSITLLGLEDWAKWEVDHSKSALYKVTDASIDVMHQDGNHSDEVCSWEVQNWSKKLRAGGYWFMDDTNWETTTNAQKWLKKNGFTELHVDDGGWSIFQKNG